jgi:MFS transporter, UMF1 family
MANVEQSALRAPTAARTRPTKLAVASWILYDLANTIFSMGVITLFFSLWVRDEVGADQVDTVYGIITAISMGIIFVVSPVLGAVTDRAPRRMPFLIISTVLCVICTAFLARADFYITVILFIIANIMFQAGLQFYDSMLPDVSTEENQGKIGGLGVGFGYLGSFIAVGIGIGLTAGGKTLDKPLAFLLVAVLFLLFALPCFIFVKERGNPRPERVTWPMIKNSVGDTLALIRSGDRYPGLIRFLVGRVFYTDSINTVISVMALYTVNIAISSGLSKEDGEAQANLILFAAIVFAMAGGFFWGWMTDKIGPKRALNLVLWGWIAVFIGAALIGILGLPLFVLYGVAAAAGFFLGGLWSADRPYMLRLTPPARVGEFYGLYGMVGRFSAITGPLIWALSTYVTIQLLDLAPAVGQGIGVLILLVMVIISVVILGPVSDARRTWSGADLLDG